MRTLCPLVLAALIAPALAQEDSAAPQDAAGVDEIIVPGRRPENLRVEIERLEEVVYDRWNALNGNDEFDIHCREMEPTGRNIPLRTCAPNFVIRAESRAGEDTLRDQRIGAQPRDPSEYKLSMEQKSRQLTEEMQRVAREDEQFLRDLVRLDELRQLQASERERRSKR